MGEEFNLQNFSTDTSTKYMYEFEGQCFKKEENKNIFGDREDLSSILDLGARERKLKSN